METPSNVVLLYSKYSPNCKILMDNVKMAGVDFIFPLCIDNQEVRNKIKSSRYSISTVPCLLVVYGTGSVEKFEGNTAHSWVDSLLARLRPPPPPQKIVSFKEIDEDDEDEDEEGPPPPPVAPKRKARAPPKLKQHKSGRKQTSVNQLLEISENEEEDEAPSVFMENLEEIDPEKLGETVKKAVKSPSATNIMAAAQEMQKMRENEDTKVPRPPVGGK